MPHPEPAAPTDVVYTWVDGAWPGYDELLHRHASNRHDLNPNRYRDNVDVLKYSLRSLDRCVPWIRQVYLATCRPQVPPWLDRRTVRVVHHDAFMPAAHLPTFNSFAIVANLHRIPGLSERFIYMVDDVLFGRELARSDLFAPDGRILLYPHLTAAPAAATPPTAEQSPWNLALARSNALLDARYGRRRRRLIRHAPQPIDRSSWQAMIDVWPDAFAQTSASAFRAPGNVAPEYLYPYYLAAEGLAVEVPLARSYLRAAYHPLNNLLWFQRLNFARLRWERPVFFGLNDDFGIEPNPRAVEYVRRALEAWFPTPSRFEMR